MKDPWDDYPSVLDYPNTDAGRAEWSADREAAKKRRRADFRHRLPALRAAAKACPFCGKPPAVGPTDPEQDGNAWGFVKCVNLRCAVQPEARDGSTIADERGPHNYIALAIRRWNRRA